MILKRLYLKLFSLGDSGWGKNPSGKNSSAGGESKSDVNGSSDEKSSERKDNNGAESDNRRPSPRAGSENPPDLEEVWKDFNKKLGSLFGNKSGSSSGRSGNNWGGGRNNGSGGGGTPSFNFNLKTIVGGGIALVFVWLASGFYIVEEGQTALVLRFGEYKYSSHVLANTTHFPIL